MHSVGSFFCRWRTTSSGRWWAGVLLVGMIGLVARGVYLWEISSSPMFWFLMGDGRAYDTWGSRIAAGDWIGTDVFYQAPMYPYFLGIVYWLGGHEVWLARMAQAVLGAVTCCVVACAGRAWFSTRSGLLAGLLWALYPMAWYFDVLIQKSVLDVFWVALWLWCLGAFRNQPSAAVSWLSGVTLGCLALTRENALVLAPLIPLWMMAGTPMRLQPIKHRGCWAALFVAGLVLALAPVALRNRVVGGEWALTTSQFGPNFYIGNNPQASGSYAPLRYGRGSAEFERADAIELAEQAVGRRLSSREVSRYWARQAWNWIQAEPTAWARLMWRKWALVWNAVELEDTEDPYTYGVWSVIWRVAGSVYHFGVVCVLAAWGVWLTRKRWGELWLLWAIPLVFALAVAMFFVFARYRHPLAPVLILWAGAGLAEIPRLVRERHWRELIAGGMFGAVVSIFVNWPMTGVDTDPALTLYNLGNAMARHGLHASAITTYRMAVTLNPRQDKAHHNLGYELYQAGRLTEAAEHFGMAIALRPQWAEAHCHLAHVLSDLGRAADAAEHYRRSLELDPDMTAALLGLATLRATHADASVRNAMEAVMLASRAVAKQDEHLPMALDVLMSAYEATGDFQKARAAGEQALAEAQKRGWSKLARSIRDRLAQYPP